MAGLILDPWQEFVLEHSLGEKQNGKWAATEVGLVVPRQNGKDAVLEARELAGLFLLGERLLIHSAHNFATSKEHFRRLRDLIVNTPELSRRVRQVWNAHGDEGIELTNGQRIQFRTRTKGGGRGFSADFIALNEAMILPEPAMNALFYTISGKSIEGNPQIWYTGSAVDQLVHEDGMTLARVRDRGIRGDDSLAYFEWSAPADNPDDVPDEVLDDPAVAAQANPGLGIRISMEHIALERRSMDRRGYAVERFGIGDWPDISDMAGTVINMQHWLALVDRDSMIGDPVWFAFDVSPDRSSASISVAGKRYDGLAHVELVERKRGTGWLADRLCALWESHPTAGVVCDARGPAGSLISELERAELQLVTVNAAEHAQGCGLLIDAIEEGQLRHLGQSELTNAVRGATKRPLGDAWAWSRKNSTVDISPLVACTLAFWASETQNVGGGLVFA